METNFQVLMPHEASVEIACMDHRVLKLWFGKPHLASLKNSARKLRFDAHVRKNRDHAKILSEKTLMYIDANATSL